MRRGSTGRNRLDGVALGSHDPHRERRAGDRRRGSRIRGAEQEDAQAPHRRDDGGAGASFRAALSVGRNPTFVDAGAVSVEAHLLDFDGDLYDRRLRVEVVQHLRDERRFSSVAREVAASVR